MQKTQLGKVLRIVAELDGMNVTSDRGILLTRVNSVRHMLYKNEAFREGFCTTEGCSVVECFREDCRNCSCKPTIYTGIVLPSLVENVREIRKDGRNVEIQYSRVDPSGCCSPCWQCLVAEELPNRLLERDIPLDSNGRVVFTAEDPADNGLIVGVRYVDFNGNEQRQDLVLSSNGVVTELSVLHFLEITFPERCGWIAVKTEDHIKLGRYHPSIYVPEHGHFRIRGTQPGDKMMWRALQYPYEVVFDTDPVEFGELIAWKVCLSVEGLLGQIDMTGSQRAGYAANLETLSGFFTSDLSAKNKSFHGRTMPRTRSGALGTAALFAGNRQRGWRR